MKRIFGIVLSLFLFSSLAFSQERNVEVWDFGGVPQEGAVNHISIADLDSFEAIDETGKFTAGTYTFGDLTITPDNKDRAYYEGKKNYGTQGYSSFAFEDGYCSEGMYYCNGKGGEGKRYLLLSNVHSGDIITFYARLSNSGDEKIHFASVNAGGEKDGIQDEVAPITSVSTMYSYIAETSGSYKVYTEANVGKAVYYRITRTPGVSVSGKISGLPSEGAALKFIVKETKQEISAKITGNSYYAGLPKNHSYTAVVSGVKGYGVTSATKILEIDSQSPGKITKDIAVAQMKTYMVQGKISGFDQNYKFQKNAALIMTPPESSMLLPVEIELSVQDGDVSYQGELEPSVTYTASLQGANDYVLTGDFSFEGTESFEKDLCVEPVKKYDVNGKFIGETKQYPTSISFKNLNDGYVYSGAAVNGMYGAQLRSGMYQVICETESASTINHIVVKDAPATKDILLVKKDKTVTQIPLKKDIYVGGKKSDYKTVKQAVAAAHAMAPKSEADRITIHIAPGTYRDQVIIDTPYITLKNDNPSQEVKLTWYYGIGYKYYSAGKDGYYDSELAYDKFDKRTVSKWGVATYVKKDAAFFRAEGITFETSFNKYVTEEELKDGVESDGSINFVRKLNSDVQKKSATERSSAICVEGDKAEFLNCRFLGVQDTLYTGAGTRQYYRNCFIEGQTDFIFGDGDIVFENCEIRWCGYSDVKVPGYITAARNANLKGYLFYNCTISADSNNFQAPGVFGRPWGPNASVAFVDTILGYDGIINSEGWTSMSGNSPEKANFFEYNTQWDGRGVDVSQRNGGKIIADSSAYTPKNYFIDWKPVYYTEGSNTDIKLKKPSFTTDDDINTPYPGHTVTLHYEFPRSIYEDMSLIQWFRVQDGREILVKQSTGYSDKTYLLTKDDSLSNIKAVVSPRARGGRYGKSIVVKLDKKVNEGYSVPANAISIRPRAEGKVNVFLASDSTCKDYSSSGMWSSGVTRNEGGWGEFLQCFFNGAVSVQNYANGGRSSRNFINEGNLDKIKQQIKKGDYLFIQFGHNDCSNSSGYLEDRYVPLGTPNKKGIYPVTEGKKVRTPDSYVEKYGTTFYSYDCGGTYKWYLMQYVNAAREVGATPVLVTPVSRKYFDGKGRITPHHDSKDTSTKTMITRNNAYVEAVRQLAKEQKVILIDGFEITKNLYEKSYSDFGNDMAARALMFPGDSTHNNKLGAFIIAGEFAKQIKKNIPELAPSICHPRNALGENSDGKIMFTVNQDGKITCDEAYWQRYEQAVMDSLGN